MKTRKGFVSNSSSSSFIIKEKDKELAESFGINLISVKFLIELYSSYKEKVEKVASDLASEKNFNSLPYFLSEDFLMLFDDSYLASRLSSLKEIEAENPRSFISEPFDRDEAYTKNIVFDVFEGDL